MILRFIAGKDKEAVSREQNDCTYFILEFHNVELTITIRNKHYEQGDMWRGVLIGKVNHYFQSEHQIISLFLQALSTMDPTRQHYIQTRRQFRKY